MFDALRPLIYLISDGTTTANNFADNKQRLLRLISVAAVSGVSLVQLREKQLSAKLLYELTAAAVEVTKNARTKLLINDRADIALAAGADGVHLTGASLSAGTIRRNFPANFVIGVSTHSLEQAAAAKREKTDFVAFSPVFATPSKEQYGAPQGIERLGEVCARLAPFPVVALGGVNERNYQQTFAVGASGVAAIRWFNNARTLPAIVERIRNE